MSFQLLAWAVEQKTGSPTRKAVLMSVANAANHQTGKCCPVIERIAEETELSERTVRRALDELCDGETPLLGRSRNRRSDGTLGPYHYTFPVSSLSQPPDRVTADPPDRVTAQEPRREPLEREANASLSAPEPEKPPGARARDPVWDACEAIWGAPANDVERSRRAKAVKLYRQAFKAEGLDEADALTEIQQRFNRYSERYDHIALPSDIALASRWSESKPPMTIPRRY